MLHKPWRHNDLPDESIERLEAIKLVDDPAVVPIVYSGLLLTCPKCKTRIAVCNPHKVA